MATATTAFDETMPRALDEVSLVRRQCEAIELLSNKCNEPAVVRVQAL